MNAKLGQTLIRLASFIANRPAVKEKDKSLKTVPINFKMHMKSPRMPSYTSFIIISYVRNACAINTFGFKVKIIYVSYTYVNVRVQ